ncbi:hypothetical protein ACFQAT_14400 [Undibacterium arcticum]|uniref:hypothetical protein n=1 Tax=Undibacterium arcticum TaxID=1762892 RepID=UPI00360B3BB3
MLCLCVAAAILATHIGIASLRSRAAHVILVPTLFLILHLPLRLTLFTLHLLLHLALVALRLLLHLTLVALRLLDRLIFGAASELNKRQREGERHACHQ